MEFFNRVRFIFLLIIITHANREGCCVFVVRILNFLLTIIVIAVPEAMSRGPSRYISPIEEQFHPICRGVVPTRSR